MIREPSLFLVVVVIDPARICDSPKSDMLPTFFLILLEPPRELRHISGARAHGLWTYEPRQGRKAATVVCSASAVVTLAFDFRLTIDERAGACFAPLNSQP